MIPRIFYYFIENNEVECKIASSLNDLENIILNDNYWPSLLHIAFEGPLSSSVRNDLLGAPKALFVSSGFLFSGLPNSWEFDQNKIININDLVSYPCIIAFGQNLSEVTSDLSLLNNQIKDINPNTKVFHDYALKQWEWSVRTQNVLNDNNIGLLSELVRYSERELLVLPNFGRKSLYEITNKLNELGCTLFMNLDDYHIKSAFDENDKMILYSKEILINNDPEGEKVAVKEDNKFIYDFLSSVEKLNDSRAIEILKKRAGFSREGCQTLEQIGQSYNVTRERIRQIEAKAIKKMKHYTIGWNMDQYWDKKIKLLLENRIYPLLINDLKDNISFSDIDIKNIGTLKYIFSHLDNPVYILNELDTEFITRLHKQAFDKIISDLKSFLKNCNQKPFSYIYNKGKSIFPETAYELVNKSIDYCLRNSAIGLNDNDEQYLINYSSTNSVTNIVIEIFAQADSIMTNKEIQEYATAKYPNADIRTIQNRINTLEGIYPMSHGSWGRLGNLNLNIKELAIVKDEIQFFIDKLTADQFHSREIRQIIFEKKVIKNEIFDDFVVSAIIREYFNVPYLGRQMFANPDSEEGKRIFVHDVLHQVLITNGKPMHSKDLLFEANKIRSMHDGLPVFIKEPIVLLGKGFYGLDYWDDETNNLR